MTYYLSVLVCTGMLTIMLWPVVRRIAEDMAERDPLVIELRRQQAELRAELERLPRDPSR